MNPERIFGIQKKHMTYTQQIIKKRNLKVGSTFVEAGIVHTIRSINEEAGEMRISWTNNQGVTSRSTVSVSGFESMVSVYGFITEINGVKVGK